VFMEPQGMTGRHDQKHFLVGLHPGPPPDHKWEEHGNYSIYTAEQHRSTWERHTHDCTQITIATGPAQVRGEWEGATGRMERREMYGDTVWIVPPSVQHIIHFDQRAPLIHLYLNDAFFRSMVESGVEDAQRLLVPSLLVRDPFLVELGKALYEEMRSGTASTLYCQSMATLTGTHLMRRYSRRSSALPVYRGGLGPTREKKIRSYIRENLTSQLSLDELARVVEMSPNYFLSLFRQATGVTPHKYVIQMRLELAHELLAQSKLTLLQIAQRCGFQDQSQFTTTFRRFTGVTPGQYRRQL
jgi:AraC family transcriptional regulator